MTLGALFLTEDKALRDLLKGMTVNDQRGDQEGVARPVGVWFGMPDQEIRDQSYPYVTIDMIDISEARDRAMRGYIEIDYLKPTLGANKGYEIEMPVPINLDYQITTYSRNPRHDRQILTQLLYTRLPFRFGTVIPADDTTVRRLDVLDVAKRDTIEQAKRLFMNAITVRISSEIAQTQYKELYKVQSVHLSSPALSPIRGTRFVGPPGDIITA
jgi:hypothetical protein